MTTYAVGDIQGCLTSLQCLLDEVQFDPRCDTLWSVGDMVNRGPDSLETLRFLKGLGSACVSVLGNHDLHLLAVSAGIKSLKKNDTFGDILQASDKDELLFWLRQQPLLHHEHNSILVHAGIPHIWPINKAIALASEVEAVLRSDQYHLFLKEMYGNKPEKWCDSLQGMNRLRTITNYLTRMRLCTADGLLNLSFKQNPTSAPINCAPWFSFYPENSSQENTHFFFGHWAALESKDYHDYFHALDSGCVWGNKMTLIDIDSKQRFYCEC